MKNPFQKKDGQAAVPVQKTASAEKKVSGKKDRAGKGLSLKKMRVPDRRSINFAEKTKKKGINLLLAIPLSILVMGGAVLFSREFVVSRLLTILSLQREIRDYEGQTEALKLQLSGFDGLEEEYAVVTMEGMTGEELVRTDRMAVVDLLERVVYPKAYVSSWSLQDNVLTLPMIGYTLGEINQIMQELQAEELVEYCMVSTAATGTMKEDSTDIVTAQIQVYLVREPIVREE